MESCKAHDTETKYCKNGFRQTDFCNGDGIAARKGANVNPYKLRKECYPQCLWDDGVTEGLK